MQAFKLNLTVKVPENEAQRTQLESCSISSLLESYLLNFYGKEVPIEKNEYDGTGVALFAYMHDCKLSYFLILESPIKAVDINLVTEKNILKFRLKNTRKLDRKVLNLIRNQEIQAIIK